MFVLVGQALWACEACAREIDREALTALRRTLRRLERGELEPVEQPGLMREEMARSRQIAACSPQLAILVRYAEAYEARLASMRIKRTPLTYVGAVEPVGAGTSRLYTIDLYLEGRRVRWIDIVRTRPTPRTSLIKFQPRTKTTGRSSDPARVRRGPRRFRPSDSGE